MPLTIQSKNMDHDIVVLELAGKITMGNDCRQVEWTTRKLVDEKKTKVIFDLSQITHLDSTGIGIIVTVAGQMRDAGGKLCVAAASDHVEHLLKVTNVHHIVDIHPTTNAAVAAF